MLSSAPSFTSCILTLSCCERPSESVSLAFIFAWSFTSSDKTPSADWISGSQLRWFCRSSVHFANILLNPVSLLTWVRPEFSQFFQYYIQVCLTGWSRLAVQLHSGLHVANATSLQWLTFLFVVVFLILCKCFLSLSDGHSHSCYNLSCFDISLIKFKFVGHLLDIAVGSLLPSHHSLDRKPCKSPLMDPDHATYFICGFGPCPKCMFQFCPAERESLGAPAPEYIQTFRYITMTWGYITFDKCTLI